MNISKMSAYRKLHPTFPSENCVFTCRETNVNFIQNVGITTLEKNIEHKIINSIENEVPLTMTRYNDGEWIALLKLNVAGNYTKMCNLIKENGIQFVDNKMMPIIKSRPNYYIGISSQTLKHTWIMDKAIPFIHGLQLYDGGIFSRWIVECQLKNFIEVIKDKEIIIVGPKYLKDLTIFHNFTLIDTGDHTASWNEYERIKFETFNAIKNIKNNIPIVLYCASFVGKVIIDDVYNDINNIIQFDLGSALDNFVLEYGSRSWHYGINSQQTN